MFPFDKQVVTVIRQGKVGTDTTDEPPLRAGFGISERPSRAPMRPRAHDSGAGRWAQPHALSHHNDVCWHIISGRTWQIQQKSDHIEVILEAVYVRAGLITTEEVSLLFSQSGVPNKVTLGNVWLPEMHDAFVAPRP